MAGYQTALAGLQHVASDPAEIGYDEVLPIKSKLAVDVVPAAVEFLNREHEKPFFLTIGFFETHRPFEMGGNRAADAGRVALPAPVPDGVEVRQDMAEFVGMLERMDAGISTILNTLDKNNLTENTLIICTTDHGLAFPHMKCNLTQHGQGVMLIMRGPNIPKGTVNDSLVSQVDIFPTLCDMLEIPKPEWLTGQSLHPLIRGEADEVNEVIYGEVNYHAAYEPMRAIRSKRYNYIRYFGEYCYQVLSNVDDSPAKTMLVEGGWGEKERSSEMLFDLLFDPTESNNIVADKEYTDVLNALRTQLTNWMNQTNDPLLSGKIDAPPGAQLNYLNALSPKEPTFVV